MVNEKIIILFENFWGLGILVFINFCKFNVWVFGVKFCGAFLWRVYF